MEFAGTAGRVLTIRVRMASLVGAGLRLGGLWFDSFTTSWSAGAVCPAGELSYGAIGVPGFRFLPE